VRRLSSNPSTAELADVLREVQRAVDLQRAGNPVITGDLDMRNFRLLNVGAPQESNDAAILGGSSGGYAPIDSAYVVIGGPDATLTDERALVAGNGITLTDNGAGANLVVQSAWNPTAAIIAWLENPTSANLRAAMTDESGTGALLFAGGDIGAATGTSLALTGGSFSVTAGNRIYFNGAAANPSIRYSAITSALIFAGGGGTDLLQLGGLVGNALAPGSAGGTTLGAASTGFAGLYLDETGAGTDAGLLRAPASLAAGVTWDLPGVTGLLASSAAALTAGGVPYIDANGQLAYDADLTFSTDTLTARKVRSVSGTTLATDEYARFGSTSGDAWVTAVGTGDLGFRLVNHTGGRHGGMEIDADNGVMWFGFRGNAVVGSTEPSIAIDRVNGTTGFTDNALSQTLKLDYTAGTFSTYGAIATVARGVPAARGVVSGATVAATLAATTVYAAPATGYYRVNYAFEKTRAATTSSSLTPIITYTGGDSVVAQTVTLPANANNSTTTGAAVGSYLVYARTGTNIQIGCTYASTGATTMQYNYRVIVEAL